MELTALRSRSTIRASMQRWQNRCERHLASAPIDSTRARSERRLQHKVATGLDDEASQSPGGVGTRIDINPIGPEVGCADGTMAVNHDLGEVFLAKQKIFAYPKQVFLPLV